jgi:phage baseplate assembly protein W
MSRVDQITSSYKQIEFYSDFPNSFTKHPVSNEIVVIKGVESVRQSLKNVILTNLGEKLFSPFFGSNVTHSLFELEGPFLSNEIIRHISLAAAQFEPRVNIINVAVNNEANTNRIDINIVFSIMSNPNVPIDLTINIKRVR